MNPQKPKVVVLCGSSRFADVMAVCSWLIERDEKAITMGLHFLPVWYPNCPEHHLAEHEGVAEHMDELHLRKIDLADEIFVVNLYGYIGESTVNELAYATSLNKPIRRYTTDPVGKAVSGMLQQAARQANDSERIKKDSDMGKEYNDYFLIDNYQYVAYVPIGMVDSLYTQRADNDGYDEKGRVNVVFVTRSGKEYIQPGFKNQTAAQDFCHKMMMHIESYNIDSLLAFGAQKKSSE